MSSRRLDVMRRVDEMKALLVHPGTQHSFHLAKQLQWHGCLSRFWTGFAYDPQSVVGCQIAYLPTWAQRRLAGRRLTGLPPDKLRTRLITDLRALSRLRVGQDEQKGSCSSGTPISSEIAG